MIYQERGFTLVEMLVAVSLFAVVMVISAGALLDMVSANRKAQSLQSVINNLNVALDGMVRNVRMGTTYHCGSPTESSLNVLATRQSCASGNGLLSFESFGGSTTDNSDQWVYWVENGRLYKSEDGKRTALAITAPEIQIDSFRVYVTGATQTLNRNGDTVQPKVVFSLQGTAAAAGNTSSVIGDEEKIRSTFNIQAVATQRVLDL
tara:strand:+ start:10681 stop:11298 length:618 start_codon:yes stop_codon:yes gene_type:complete